MKFFLLALLIFVANAQAGTTQLGHDSNLNQKSSGGQSLPVVGLCDYVHPCAGQAAPVSLRDNTNGQKAPSSAPSQSTATENVQ